MDNKDGLLQRLGRFFRKTFRAIGRFFTKIFEKIFGRRDPGEPLVIREQFGDEEIELTKPDPGGSRYYATIDPNAPTVFTEDEIEEYTGNLIGEDYQLPETLHNGEPLPDELELEEMMIDNQNGLRRIVFSKKVNWKIFKAVQVTRSGISIKKHDGSV